MSVGWIECETCIGSGEILIGWSVGTRLSPPDPVDAECIVCEGEGAVDMFGEFDEVWGGRFPTAEEAAEVFRMRSEG